MAVSDNVAVLDAEPQEQLRSKTLLQKAMWRLWHDRLTMTALAVLGILTVACYAAPIIVELIDIEYNSSDLYNSRLEPFARVSDSDTTVYQWVVETGVLRRSFIGHNHEVYAVSFHPNSQDFITGSVDGEVRIWDIPTGRNLRRLEEHTAAVNSVDFTSDGEKFLTASGDGLVKLWETDKAVKTDPDIPLMELEHDGPVTGAAYSPDDSLVASSSGESVFLWSAETGRQVLELSGHTDTVNTVEFGPTGETLATGGDDNTARLWNVDTGEFITSFDHDDAVLSVALGVETLLTGSSDGVARLWDLTEGTVIYTFDEFEDAVTTVHYTADGTQVYAGSRDGSVRLYDAGSGELVQTFAQNEYVVESAAISPDGTSLVTGTDGRQRLYILATDISGRDHLTRLLYGGQVSLRIGFFAAIGSLTIGILLGVTTGYFGGIFDDFVIWLITTLNSVPQLFLLLIISSLLSPNATSLILVLVFLGWTGSTRIVRGETFALREREFILAAQAVGASSFRIMFLHITPNVISILLIVLTRAVGGLILTESALSFLGFGVKPPTPTWGNMLSGGLELLRTAPHLVFGPGILITITVLCLFVIGDGLRDAFDPKIAD